MLNLVWESIPKDIFAVHEKYHNGKSQVIGVIYSEHMGAILLVANTAW